MTIMILLLAFALVGLAVVAVPDAIAAMSADDMLADLDTRSAALTDALDPERRKAALDEILKPFQEGEMYAYVPRREGIDPATKRFIEEEDQQAAYKVFHLEDFTRKAEPAVMALEAREKLPPTAEGCCLTRANLAGLSLADSLSVQVLDELRQIRLAPFVQSTSASAQLSAWDAAAADPTEAYNSTLIRMMEATHLNGFSGPKPENPEDLKAAQLLRKRIVEVREARVSESTRKLQARLAEAKRQIAKAKMLHQLAPANPSHPGAVRER